MNGGNGAYTPFLIANYATGFDQERQPWLLPEDAQDTLLDGFVYLGVWQKRPGYNGFAIGQKGEAPYTESRMVSLQAPIVQADNGTAVYVFAATPFIARGYATITGSNPAQSFTDDGLGRFLDATINITNISSTNPAEVTTALAHGYTTGDQVIITGVTGMYAINIPVPYTITVTSATTFTLDGIDATALPYSPYVSGGTVQKVIGSIDYTTGAITIVLPQIPIAASTVTLTYSIYSIYPVMGIANYWPINDIREMITMDTHNVNKYDEATNRMVDITTRVYTGNNSNFFSWTNYPNIDASARLLFVNNIDPIQQYSGGAVSDFIPALTSTETPFEAYGTGDGTPGPFVHAEANPPIVPTSVLIQIKVNNEAYGTGTGVAGPYVYTVANPTIVKGSITITESTGGKVVTDNSFGQLQGQGSGTVDYTSGFISVTFSSAVAVASNITITYTTNAFNVTDNGLGTLQGQGTGTVDYTSGATSVTFLVNIPVTYDILVSYSTTASTLDTCLHIFQFKDRLVCLRTTEDTVVYPRRIRISGFGQQGDDFRTTATGAGLIDIPDQSWIMAAAFNRDDLIIFTEKSTWIMKYTGDDTVPFVIDKLDESRGSEAPFSGITYLNKTSTGSRRGLIITDGYKVERMDEKLPAYSFNDISQSFFNLCFAGTVDQDRNHYLIHPSPGQVKSDRILVTNYEEENFAVYRIPLSCMGEFLESYEVTWNDLFVYNSWDEMAQDYFTWNDFGFTKGLPFPVGGGHRGEIWRLNVENVEDNPQKIRNITLNSPTNLQITTDNNNYVYGDYIYITGITGLSTSPGGFPLQLQGYITSVVDNYTFNLEVPTMVTGTYLYGGIAAKVIQFESTTKKLNPFVEQDQKIRIGWLYMYVTTSGTFLRNPLTAAPINCTIYVDLIVNDNQDIAGFNQFNVTPYRINCTNIAPTTGNKTWYKIWINQTGRFLQMRVRNAQAGSDIQIHAMMPGMAGIGRLV